MTKSRGILPRRRYWSDQEIELVRQRYHDTPTAELAAQLGRPADAVYRLANKLELKKDPALLSAMARERSARPDHGGRATRFQKGLVPPNKGFVLRDARPLPFVPFKGRLQFFDVPAAAVGMAPGGGSA